jgi:hypothetical protein
MHIRLETNPDEPDDTWVVLFRPDGDGGAAMTPQEAARVACELWQIAAKGQAAA